MNDDQTADEKGVFALYDAVAELRAKAANIDQSEPTKADRLTSLLQEAYVFIGMPHKALRPWRIALDEWQSKVEAETGWDHFDEVKKFEGVSLKTSLSQVGEND